MSPTPKRARRYRAILFDLFGTLVFFRLPPIVGGHRPAHLQAAVERELPGVAVADFFDALSEVSREIAATRRSTHEELPSRQRFLRALECLGIPDPDLAERLSLAHMGGLAAASEMPEHHRDILRALRARYRIALVSNFDHGATAREILRRHRLDEFLEQVLISDEFGWRKPTPGIFHAAIDALGVPASEAVHVGDTPLDDIEGASRAGIDAIWIKGAGDYPPGLRAPTLTIARLAELPDRLL